MQGRQKGLKPDGSPTKRGFSHAEIQQVLESDGQLPLRELLRCRVRYFSDGVALGSRDFVENMFQANRDRLNVKREVGARQMKHGEWGDTFVMRDLRLEAISLPSP